MTVSPTLKKIWNITTTVLVAIVVLIAVFLMGARVLGYQVFTVISGSMEPEYSVGDLIYVKDVDPESVQVKDPITFVLNENLDVATHRVVRIDAEKQHFYTKGDANDNEDSAPVHFNNLIGRPVFAIPYLGYVSQWIQNPPGTYIAVGAAILLLAAMFLPDLIKKENVVPAAVSEETQKEREELEKMRAEIESAKAELEKAKQELEQKSSAEKEPEQGE